MDLKYLLFGLAGGLLVKKIFFSSNASSEPEKPVYPLDNANRYYKPSSLGGTGYWSSLWNFGTERGRWHYGIDLVPLVQAQSIADLENKHPVYAFLGGVVTQSEHTAYGYIIKIKHSDTLETRYLHLLKSIVQKGQTVKAGQRIGTMGWEGSSPNDIRGSHLHFEVFENGKNVNPTIYLKKPLGL